MQQRIATTTVITYGLLAMAGAGCFLLPPQLSISSVQASNSDGSIYLTGTVRDFRAAHVDFNVTPAKGFGHCAGNVAYDLGKDGVPVFGRESDGSGPFDSRMAHWKFDDAAGSTATDEKGLNPGTLMSGPTWTTGRMDGALRFDGNNDYVEIPSSKQMQIQGDVTFSGWFMLDDDFDSSSPDTLVIMEKFLDTEHDFHVALAGLDYNRSEVPKGTLVFKVENGPTSDYYCYVWTNRDSWDADTWYHFAATLSSADTTGNNLFIDGVKDTDSTIAAGVGFLDSSFDAPMRIGGKTIDYNGHATDIHFKGLIDDVVIFNRALTEDDFTNTWGGYRVDDEWTNSDGDEIAPHLSTPDFFGKSDSCSAPLADVVGAAGTDSDADITSAASFDGWFRDVLGQSLSVPHTIKLTRNGSVYEYLNDSFHPIDDALLGNEGAPHNQNLTYTVAAEFIYSQCSDQFIEFQGGDGAWMFINGYMVLDLGGTASGTKQTVDLDRLTHLEDGEKYMMQLFYSQRHPISTSFRLRTNLELLPRVAVYSAGFD